MESLIKISNSGFEVAYGLEEGIGSSSIGHVNKLYDAHLRKIWKSKFR